MDIFDAAQNGDLSQVVALIEGDPSLVRSVSVGGYTPLHRAALNGHIEVMDFLLKRGADIQAKVDTHWTALHIVADDGNLDAVKFLVSKGADVNATTPNNTTPYQCAERKRSGHDRVAEFLSKKNADPGVMGYVTWASPLPDLPDHLK
jgi:ankyrin repeat protein